MEWKARTLQCVNEYIKMGWSVLPLFSVADGRCACGKDGCTSPGKHPHSSLAPKGLMNATTDANIVQQWFSTNVNIGIRTGTESKLLVLDVDPRHGGDESLNILEAEYGKIDTLEAISGGGGRHLYFEHPGIDIHCSNGKLGAGLDIKAANGYVLAPPSLHISGNEYKWKTDPRVKKPATCPNWLINKLVDNVKFDVSPTLSADMPIAAGERNTTLASLAGTMRRKGFDVDAIYSALVVVNRKRCQPPLDDKEIRRISESISNYVPVRNRQPEISLSAEFAELLSNDLFSNDFCKCLDFPLEAMPPVLRPIIKAGAESVQCPMDFIGIPLLTALGVAIGRSYVLEVKPGWCESTALWTVVIGRPGTAKSPALNIATKPLWTVQNGWMANYTQLKTEYENDYQLYKKELKLWERSKSEVIQPQQPDMPVMQRILVSDITVEAMAQIMKENPRGVLLARDELAGWVNAMNQYKAGKGADVQFYLSTWSGAPVMVDRKSLAEPISIPHSYLAVTGSCQPEILISLLDTERQQDGFASRLLISYPPEVDRQWVDGGMESAVLEPVEELFTRLCQLQMESDANGMTTPHVLCFSVSGLNAFKEFMNTHFAQKDKYQLKGPLLAAWAKMEGYTARLALVIHMVRLYSGDTTETAVDAKSVYMAAALSDYFLAHVARLYGLVHENKSDSLVTRVCSWAIRKNLKEITPREIVAARIVENAESAIAVLGEMFQKGFGLWLPEKMQFILNDHSAGQLLSRSGI